VSGVRTVTLETDGCKGTPYEVRYLEHVQAVVTVTSTRRGELEMFLTSPMGTRSTLVARRLRDTSTDGFTSWAFMTTHSWGEIASGVWALEIHNGMGLMSEYCGVSLAVYLRMLAALGLVYYK
jgi:furin